MINDNFLQGDLAQEATQQAIDSFIDVDDEISNINDVPNTCENCANFYACNEDGDQESTKNQIKNCFTQQ
jgi:hypothetical protein